MKKYINHFFSLNCAVELLPFFKGGHKVSAKEITESFAMLYACYDVGIKYDQEGVVAVVVGDGIKPRTAALMAFLTKWRVISVDPDMRLDWINSHLQERADAKLPEIARLQFCRARIQDTKWGPTLTPEEDTALIVMPHSHAPMQAAIDSVWGFKHRHVVSMPCCDAIPGRFLAKPYAKEHELRTYIDPDVWSPKNQVYAWRNV